MRVKTFNDYQEISDAAASAILNQVKQKPDSVLCLASGDTAKLAYKKMVEKAKKEQISFSDVHFVGLDEWIGILPQKQGNCALFLRQIILSPLKIPEDQIYFFDSMANDLDKACKKMDDIILKKGGIDLMVVGIGMNGHVGFNEPGVSQKLKSHVILLDETTQKVGQKYFKEPQILKKGITLGLQHLLDAKKVILMANGIHKAKIIKEALAKEVSVDIPASIIRNHGNSLVMLDKAAASSLTPKEMNL